MEKKTLNLNFVELEHLEEDNEICLMPCPCSATAAGIGDTIGGYIAGKIIDNVLNNGIPAKDPCTGSLSPCGGPCGTDSDWGGITADIEGGDSGGGGGGK
ncbi:MAG: hypothetical protein KKE44_23525 [Proteobacteria bacterium]|nr:hypothetical protein [Pseudomonadota bacterium]MBU1585703.1 hypothetical protein [Pseudomonadota bacterium]MBU2629204.1 hypothetical protein [Pseudomonadota bacterium]